MTGHIFIYGAIGTKHGEVSLQNVKTQIEQNKSADELEVHFFSPGGDVFEGYAIYNALLKTGKRRIARIEALCASISSLIAFSCDEIWMDSVSEFMVHNPKITDLQGDANDIRNTANQLDKIKNILVDVAGQRAERNGKPISKEKLWELYDNETWLNAQEAVAIGFADRVVDAIKAVAKVDLKQFNMEANQSWLQGVFKNLFGLKKFKNEFTETLQDGTQVVVMSEDGDWTGKTITTVDGQPLPPGEYTLASGKVITVGENSTIGEVKEPTAAAENTEEDMSKIKELENQLAAANEAKAAAEAKVAELSQSVTQTSAKFEARFKALEEKQKKDEEELKKVIGETPNLNQGPSFVNLDNPAQYYDPMGEEAISVLRSRNRI